MDNAPFDFNVFFFGADASQQDRQKYRIIVQRQPGQLPVPAGNGFADPAVVSAVYLEFFDFKFRLVRFYIAEHGFLSTAKNST
ncbi:hypothetical protein SDC9_184190 [bioreactor metagenome]|uniref:Uncharacterized protein n=1 Tax=bioreactor metagenome TaxID=1076179 RepID=A0A645HD78_9ZZZZ